MARYSSASPQMKSPFSQGLRAICPAATKRGCGDSFFSQAGFSLLELMLVVVLLSLIASTGFLLTSNIEDQNKYDETLRKRDMIKQAILGDTTRTLNGAPELGGFLADMGRLPSCIEELYEAKLCGTETAIAAWQIDAITGLGRGWRGPYLESVIESDGHAHFRDGYGCDWSFTQSTSGVQVQSLGADCLSGGAGLAEDIPASAAYVLISEDDYLTVDRFYLTLFNQTSATSAVTINPSLWQVDLGVSEVEFAALKIDGGTTPITLAPGESTTAVVEFNSRIPMGLYSLALDCESCSGVQSVSTAYPITLLPRHQIPTFKWIVEPQ